METGRLGKALIVVLVCLVLVLGIIGLKLFALWHEPTAAYFEAQDRVKKLLLASASAGFPVVLSPVFWDGAVNVASLGDGGYRVTAWVDASNKFGAKLRSRWVCDVKKLSAMVWVRTGQCGGTDKTGLWREGEVVIAP